MLDFQQRLVDEKRELDTRREKLGAFKNTDLFAGLPWQEQERLNAQAHIMTMYSAVLGERIAAFVNREQKIDEMVSRFLGWKLPKDFAPDAGISFKPMPDEYMPHCWPTGTNLFNAEQAREMILYILGNDT